MYAYSSASSVSKINIVIIEDSEIHAAWLKAELQNDVDFSIVNINRLARDGIDAVRKNNPDIVLLDFQLEDLTGLEVARRIKAHNQDIKVFMLTAHTEISIIERILHDKNIDALAIKGSQYFGYNLKSAIKNVANGGVYLDPSLLTKLRESKKDNGLHSLTRREFEVLIQSYSGKADEVISKDLCVELAYIKNIKSKISKKIQDACVDNLLYKLVENANPDKSRQGR